MEKNNNSMSLKKLNLIASRPAVGKTSFSLSLALYEAQFSKNIIFINLSHIDNEPLANTRITFLKPNLTNGDSIVKLIESYPNSCTVVIDSLDLIDFTTSNIKAIEFIQYLKSSKKRFYVTSQIRSIYKSIIDNNIMFKHKNMVLFEGQHFFDTIIYLQRYLLEDTNHLRVFHKTQTEEEFNLTNVFFRRMRKGFLIKDLDNLIKTDKAS